MSIARQLYRLQELDLEIETNEQALERLVNQLGVSRAVLQARERLANAVERLEDLKKQQRTLEGQIEDLSGKIKTFEEELYSGRVKNPKELSNLNTEVESLKARRGQHEDRALGLMDELEKLTAESAAAGSELGATEAAWRSEQKKLAADIEKLKSILADLLIQRNLASEQVHPETLEFYQRLRKKRGKAVAKVEQGICRGCQISLPITDLQRARGGILVQCSSCGRILYQS